MRQLAHIFRAAVAALMLAAVSASAQTTVYNNGVPDHVNAYNLSYQFMAEDFSFAATTTFDTVRFWTWEFPNRADYRGKISWKIYANGASKPGTLLHSGVVNNPPNALYSTSSCCGYQEFQYELNIGSVTLPAGTYWLALHNGDSTQTANNSYWWATTANNSTSLAQIDVAPFDDNYSSNFTHHAFQLVRAGVTAEPGQVLISEFRLRGQNGPADEFIELYNNTDSPITVGTSDGSVGWTLRSSDGSLNQIITNGVTIPARSHYLLANMLGFSLSGYPGRTHGVGGSGADQQYSGGVPTNLGLALFRTANSANFTLANRLDAAGSTSEANSLYREGAGYAPVNDIDFNYSLLRDLSANRPKDTQDNQADFRVVAVGTNTVRTDSVYGYPSPENSLSPVERNAKMPMTTLDPSQPASAAPNRVRDTSATAGPCSTFGTLSIRRTVTNTTGAPVTRLRFRIIDITTAPAPAGTADLRPLTSGDISVTVGGVTRTVRGLTLEAAGTPPNNCGGLNSSLSLGNVTPTAPDAVAADGGSSEVSAEAGDGEWDTVDLNAPLNAGQSMDVHFLFGVQQTGSFRVFVNVEVLP